MLDVEGFRKKSKELPAEPAPEPVAIIEPYRYPRPPEEDVFKRIKEWQIGPFRTFQIVKWLCDPFSSAGVALEPPTATMERVPKLSELQPGTKVAGIVVGVAGFGVFVELGPDCNGLVHVSRLSDRFVEDMNEAVQVGDVLVAWVTGVDAKRRRVALSAVSPEREAELAAQKQSQAQNRPPRGRGGNRRPEGQRGAAAGSAPASGGQARGGRPEGGRGRGGDGPRRGRDGGGRRGDRESTPRTFTKVARNTEPPPPISEAMEKGVEPLRSFGDLAQFLQKKNSPPAAPKPKAKPVAKAPASESAPPASESATTDAANDPATAGEPVAKPATEPVAENAPTSETQADHVASESKPSDSDSDSGSGA